jgi:hypothetical protein
VLIAAALFAGLLFENSCHPQMHAKVSDKNTIPMIILRFMALTNGFISRLSLVKNLPLVKPPDYFSVPTT